jgi:cation transport regulator ChaB
MGGYIENLGVVASTGGLVGKNCGIFKTITNSYYGDKAGNSKNSANNVLVHRVIPCHLQESEDLYRNTHLYEILKKRPPYLLSLRLYENSKKQLIPYLHALWNKACNAAQEWKDAEFKKDFESQSEGFSLVIIEMPKPERTLDAKYIAFVYFPEQVRYFIFELSYKIDKEDENKYEKIFFLCEWTKDGVHRNYGRKKDTSLEGFVNAVKTILGIQ